MTAWLMMTMMMMLTGSGAQGAAVAPPLSDPALVAAPRPRPPGRAPAGTAPVLLRSPPICLPRETGGHYDFSQCFHDSDYPLAAYEARRQGVTGVRVTLGPDGRPQRCEVTVSSGSGLLNRTTCELLRERILAAYDRGGQPVRGAVIAGEMRWSLPAARPRDYPVDLLTYFSQDDYPAAALRGEEQGIVTARIDIDPRGRVANCTVTASSGSNALDAATCRIMRSRVRYRPARNRRGRPVPGLAFIHVTWQLPTE